MKYNKKYYIVTCTFHKSYVAETEEQVKELINNDPSVPDMWFEKEILDCSDVDDDWSIGEKNTQKVLDHLSYEEDYNKAVLNSLMQVND